MRLPERVALACRVDDDRGGQPRGWQFGLAIFGVLAIYHIAMAVNAGGTTTVNNQSLMLTSVEATNLYGSGSDIGRYLANGFTIAREGWLTPQDYWSINLSAPGMMILWSLIIRVVGEQGHGVLAIVVFNCLVWSAAMASWATLLARWIRLWVVAALLAVFYTSPLFLQFFSREGALWSDSYASALGVLAVVCAARLAANRVVDTEGAKGGDERDPERVLKPVVVAAASGGATLAGVVVWALWGLGVPMVLVMLALVSTLFLLNPQANSPFVGFSGRQASSALCCGLVLGLAAYARTVFEPIGAVITMLAIPVVGIWLVALILARIAGGRMTERGRTFAAWLGPSALALLLIALAFQVVTMPYRHHRETTVTPGRSSWVVTQDLVMVGTWIPNEVYEQPDAGGWFVYKGRGNSACNVEPEKCAAFYEAEMAHPSPYLPWDDEPYSMEYYRSEVIHSLLTKPHRWLAHKGAIFPSYWFSATSKWPVTPLGLEYVWNGAFLAASIGAAVAALWALVRHNFVFGLIILLLMGATFGAPFLAHFEVRYFFPLKVMGWTALPLLLCLICRGRQPRDTAVSASEKTS